MKHKDTVSWNALISGYVEQNHSQEALHLFYEMWQVVEVAPDSATLVSTLKACTCLSAIDHGKEIHTVIIERSCWIEIKVMNALIDMYARCGGIQEATWLFYDVKNPDRFTWSAMIACFSQHNLTGAAFQLFQHMQDECVEPDHVILTCILKVAAENEDLVHGQLIHGSIIAVASEQDVIIGSVLIDMYSKCGSLDDARQVFQCLTGKNVVTWSAMIEGYADNEFGAEAFFLFQEMLRQGIMPNNVTFLSLLKACCNIGLVDHGKLIHVYIILEGCEQDPYEASTLIGMYLKCGSIEDATVVFNRAPNQSVEMWTAMLGGLLEHNDYPAVWALFKRMHESGMKPNDVTFACLLSACSHLGLVREGLHYFSTLSENVITPTQEQYNGIIDLLSRGGLLSDAESMALCLPFRPDLVGWMAILNHCSMHSEVNIGCRCFDHILMMDGNYAAGYVLMSHIFRDASMLEDITEVQSLGNAMAA